MAARKHRRAQSRVFVLEILGGSFPVVWGLWENLVFFGGLFLRMCKISVLMKNLNIPLNQDLICSLGQHVIVKLPINTK